MGANKKQGYINKGIRLYDKKRLSNFGKRMDKVLEY
jgi:hypothetical protein